MSISVSNKYSGAFVTDLAAATSEDVEAALASAHDITCRREHIPAFRRVEILERAAAMILADRDRLAMQIALEGGKPLRDALVEVDRAAQSTRLAGQLLVGERGQEIPMDLSAAGDGRIAFTRRVPIGPVVAVSAFNHPLNLIAHQIACGCGGLPGDRQAVPGNAAVLSGLRAHPAGSGLARRPVPRSSGVE
nr:aldehyde dehydrogenase family protein [Pacificoceanicola onchidii]